MKMIELLHRMDLLRSENLQLESLTLAGVAFGTPADEFPVHRVTEVSLAPIVASGSWSRETGPIYRDASGRLLSLVEVLESALASGGFLHLPEKVSFRIARGRVVAFSLSRDSLGFFHHINTYEQLIAEFGRPDLEATRDAEGEAFQRHLSYVSSRKHVTWDCWDHSIAHITLGDIRDANDDA